MCWWVVSRSLLGVFFFNDTATTEIYTLSLHDALPIFGMEGALMLNSITPSSMSLGIMLGSPADSPHTPTQIPRSEEHTSELQSRQYLVCRLLLEKKNPTIR